MTNSLTPSFDRLARLARGQVGVHEGRTSGGSWNNQNPYAAEVGHANGYAWCATFVCAMFKRAGLYNLLTTPSAGCDQLAAGFKAAKRWSTYPALGAVVFYGIPADLSHTGIVVGYDSTHITVVEGNTNDSGSREGDGVYLKKRLRRDAYVVGYGYPAFPEGIMSADPAWAAASPKPAKPSRPDTVLAADEVLVKPWHLSMQFSDTTAQQQHDAEAVFSRAAKRNVSWITGTEAGAASQLREVLAWAAGRHGFRLWIPKGQDSWIAVNEDWIDGDWDTFYSGHIVDAVARKHTNKGVAGVSFTNRHLGPVTVLASHFLTKGRPGTGSLSVNLEANKRLAAAMGDLAELKGKGSGLVFAGKDSNINDKQFDTYLGQADLTTAQDELGKHEGTGHGPIDDIASYDKDGRVRAVRVAVDDDDDLFLHTDHFLVRAAFAVKKLGGAR